MPWVVLLLGALLGSSARAAISCDELNTRWRTRYHGDFHVDGAADRFACRTEPAYFLAKALDDLYQVDPGHAFYNSARSFTAKTKRDATNEPGKCEPGVAAWMDRPTGTLALCPPFFGSGVAEEKRPATIFHEAAHARRNDPRHVICDHGDVEGQPGCDRSFTETFEGSGYNWEVQYTAFAKRHTTDDMSRWVLDAHVKHLLKDRFNLITPDQIRRWNQ